MRFRRSSKHADSAAEEQRPTPAEPPEEAPPLAASAEREWEDEPLHPSPATVEFSPLETPLRVVRPPEDVDPAAGADRDEAPPPLAPLPTADRDGGDEDMLGVPLGTLVFRAGLLTFEEGEEALREATATGRRLGQVLIERGRLDERQLARFLAGQKGLEFVDLESAAVDREAAARLSEESARVYRALPVSRPGGGLVVALADPTNEAVMAQIRAALGADVAFGVAASEELDRATAAAFRDAADAGGPDPAVTPEPVGHAPEAPAQASPSDPEAYEPPADELGQHDPFETPFTREESHMEPPGSPETRSEWPRPDESFGSFGREEEQPASAGTMGSFATTDAAQQYAAPQPDPAPAAGLGMSGGGGPSRSVAVRLVLRLGQTEALELGSFDDPARATAFAMTLRPFLRPGTIVSLDIADA